MLNEISETNDKANDHYVFRLFFYVINNIVVVVVARLFNYSVSNYKDMIPKDVRPKMCGFCLKLRFKAFKHQIHLFDFYSYFRSILFHLQTRKQFITCSSSFD